MEYKIHFTIRAESDLDRIADYIANRLLNPSAATALFNELMDKMESLTRNPAMYEEAKDPLLKARGYRRILFGNYLALYLVDDIDKVITITNVFYGKQNYIDMI